MQALLLHPITCSTQLRAACTGQASAACIRTPQQWRVPQYCKRKPQVSVHASTDPQEPSKEEPKASQPTTVSSPVSSSDSNGERKESSAGTSSSGSNSSSSTPPTPPNGSGNGDRQRSLTGPPAASMGSDERTLQIPRDVIERLKSTVFGFDTFWVTAVENYQENGVIFKGNVRGKDTAAVYKRLKERIEKELGAAYNLYLLEDRDGKPTAVVLPKGDGLDDTIKRSTEVWLAVVFAIVAAATTINSNGAPVLQWAIDPFRTELSAETLAEALPASLAFWFILGAHEWGHWRGAARSGVPLYLPFIVPAGFGFLGAFGAITRVKGIAPSRSALLDFAASGPLVGTAVSSALVLLGFALSAAGVVDVVIDSPSFADSLLMGTLAQIALGDRLAVPEVAVNSVLVAGWAGLVVNALNCIPAGELDGGRIALGALGRRTAAGLGAAAVLAMGVASFANTLALYWVLFIVTLQRGPIVPCAEELTPPPDGPFKNASLALLALPLLVLLPYPSELLLALQQLRDPTLIPL